MRKLLVSAAAAVCGILPATTPQAHAQGYQIDCAILLCLSGGWPASVPCARARAEFIRRITPWPVEPPLQIWRCPMSAAYSVDPDTLTADRIYEILMDADDNAPLQSYPTDDPIAPLRPEPAVLRQSGGTAARLPESFLLRLTQASPSADIDISGPEFDFVRSIRVFEIDWWEYVRENRDGDETCRRGAQRVREGTYGTQGEFTWRRTSPAVAQADDAAWLGFSTRVDDPCDHAGRFRGVGVEWRDYEGNHGFEVVRY